MTVCNDCGDTLVEVWHDVYVCPDCFFAALTIRHRRVGDVFPDGKGYIDERGTGRENGDTRSRPVGELTERRQREDSPAAKFLCPSCHQKKEWPFDKVVVPVSEDGLLSPRTFVVCNECWQKAKQ